jgi:hypothetical protein
MTMTVHEGTYQLVCPACGRVLLVEFAPFRRVVIVPGDETATHSGFVVEEMRRDE